MLTENKQVERRMTWDDMVAEYPEQWVVVRDAEKIGPDIISGILVTVKSDNDIIPYKVANFQKGYVFRRTTEGDFNGIISADLSVSAN